MPRRKRSRWGSTTTVTKHKHVEVIERPACSRLTIGKAYEEWLLPSITQRYEDGDMARNTYVAFVRNWDNITKGRWADVPVDAMKPLEIQKWVDTLTKGGAVQALKLLGKVMYLCVKYEAVEMDKFRIEYAPPKPAKRNKKVLSLKKAEDQLRKLKGCACETPLILACFGSARTAESLAVRNELEVVEARASASSRWRSTTGHGEGRSDHRQAQDEGEQAHAAHPSALRRQAPGDLGIPQGLRAPHRQRRRRRFREAVVQDAGISESGSPVPFANLRPSWRTIAQYEWHLEFETAEILMGHTIEGTTGRHYLRPSIADLAESFAMSLTMST